MTTPSAAAVNMQRHQSLSGVMVAMFAVYVRMEMLSTAFVPVLRNRHDASCACFRFANNPPISSVSQEHHKDRRRCRHNSLAAIEPREIREFDATVDDVATNNYNLSPQIFIDEVTSFLETDGIPWRTFPSQELRHVFELYFEQSSKVDEMMTLLEDRTIFAVGGGPKHKTLGDAQTNKTNSNASTMEDDPSKQQSYSFILHLCGTPDLGTMQKVHQMHNQNSSVSEAVAAYAWMNAHLTNAFFNYDQNNHESKSGDKTIKPMGTIVHLHQDVWNRSPEIVRSRLRSKCGMFHQRIYARQTIVKRIPKAVYIPFLEDNHLWGATGAKYGYGLFLKPKNGNEDETLVAVATFSSKRKVNRAAHNFHSFELLRFCTKLETTVVGGLGKLTRAFVNGVTDNPQQSGKRVHLNDNIHDLVEIDIITSIDRDFGSNTWPNTWQQMEVMDPVPMFVGDVDGLRRHAVGAGLTPLEQKEGNNKMITSMVLRSGLPDSLLCQLEEQTLVENHDGDQPWQTAAMHGFQPVFDAGVERLMLVVESENTKQLSPSHLWENSLPRYVKEHYSSNEGIENMLSCIRNARSKHQ